MTSPHPWDAIVIGGGAAGLSAAQMLGRSRRRTLVIDAGQPRNRFASHMHGILGHDGLDPAELLAKGRRELEPYGVEIRSASVEAVTNQGATLAVSMEDGSMEQTRALVLASGITEELPDIPGLAERWGTSVIHCPYCHGWEVRERRLGVLVYAAGQVHLAYMVRQLSDTVTLFTQDPDFVDADERDRLSARGIPVVDSPVTSLQGADGAKSDSQSLTHVTTEDGTAHQVDAIFTGGKPHPHDSALDPLDLARTDGPGTSVIDTERDGATSHPRVWAAGNVVNPLESVPMAASAGAVAGARVNGFLVDEDFEQAVQARAADPTAFWEGRYSSAERSWSGAVNATVALVVRDLEPGSALDLGCGEGADVIWLAQQGWRAHGLDISTTAVTRARVAATDAGASERATFDVADLAGWQATETYDLVTASFFHSPVSLPRTDVLARASAAVKPGGHLLLVTHAAPPPWANPEDARHHTFLSARQEADELALNPEQWEEVRVENVERDATGPEGQAASLTDGVVLLRRR